jgi:hypothetical protein
MLMLADASLGGTWGLADASLRGALLGETLLLAEAWLCGFSLSGSLLLADSLVIWPCRTHPGALRGVTGAFCCFSTLPLLRLLLKFPEATTMLPVITKPVAKHHGAPIALLSLLYRHEDTPPRLIAVFVSVVRGRQLQNAREALAELEVIISVQGPRVVNMVK